MTAEEFMRGHADKASSGRLPEVIGDLTQEAITQIVPLMAGGPNPAKAYEVVLVRQDGDDHLFDVTYTGDGDAKVSVRETVRQIDGAWKIVKAEKPA